MTMTKDDCQKLLDEWQLKYFPKNKYYHFPTFLGFADLGAKTRGITYSKSNVEKKYWNRVAWGEIKLNSRLRSDWRIKAVLWHEFCHHWAYSVYNYSGHQGTFDDCLRTDKVLWLLGSFSRIIPML